MNENLPETLKAVHTRPLFVMRLDVRPILQVGVAAGSDRRIGIVFGGTFEGERASGTVLDGGSDWQTVRTDGATTLDVRLVLKTTDSALISMTYTGLRHGPRDILDRLARGEDVDAASYYFRTTPHFETSDARYEWLNRVLAIGVGHRTKDGPVYSLFEIL